MKFPQNTTLCTSLPQVTHTTQTADFHVIHQLTLRLIYIYTRSVNSRGKSDAPPNPKQANYMRGQGRSFAAMAQMASNERMPLLVAVEWLGSSAGLPIMVPPTYCISLQLSVLEIVSAAITGF